MFLRGQTPTDDEVRIAIHLLEVGIVNDATAVPSNDHFEYTRESPHQINTYRHRLELDRWQAIGQLHRRQGVRVLATTTLRVRRAELEQAIQRDRIATPPGC